MLPSVENTNEALAHAGLMLSRRKVAQRLKHVHKASCFLGYLLPYLPVRCYYNRLMYVARKCLLCLWRQTRVNSGLLAYWVVRRAATMLAPTVGAPSCLKSNSKSGLVGG